MHPISATLTEDSTRLQIVPLRRSQWMDPQLHRSATSPARRPRRTTIASAQGPPQAAPPPTQSGPRQILAAAALTAGSKPDRAPPLVDPVSLAMPAMPPIGHL